MREMALNSYLMKNKSAIMEKWFDMVVETYPADTSTFLKNQKDPFANPVGSATLNGLGTLFDELAGDMDPKAVESGLDPIVRIRAIQDFNPSKAVGFIFFLKKIVRDQIDRTGDDFSRSLSDFESRVDEIGLCGFDIFMKCREKIYKIKAGEQRNLMYSAIERAGLLAGVSGEQPERRE